MSNATQNNQLGEQLTGVFSEFVVKPMEHTLENHLGRLEHRWFGDIRDFSKDQSYTEFLLQEQTGDINRSVSDAVNRLNGQIQTTMEPVNIDLGNILNRLRDLPPLLESILMKQDKNDADLQQMLAMEQELTLQVSKCRALAELLQTDAAQNKQQILAQLVTVVGELEKSLSQALSQTAESLELRIDTCEKATAEATASQSAELEKLSTLVADRFNQYEQMLRMYTETLQETLAKQSHVDKQHKWIMYGVAAVFIVLQVIQIVL